MERAETHEDKCGSDLQRQHFLKIKEETTCGKINDTQGMTGRDKNI
jgi:hypothetical protein